jgi:uncharacterized protein DUF6505
MKLLRTIRLDPSDTLIFPGAAEPGEWAVSGTFMFSDVDPATLAGKERSAFRSGFLGLPSLAWSTLAQIVAATPQDRASAIALLAQCLLDRFGAPDRAAASHAAAEEIDFAASLCNHPPGTLIAVHRSHEDGAIREAFRSLRPRGAGKPLRAFSFLEVAGEDDGASLDLAKLARGEPE